MTEEKNALIDEFLKEAREALEHIRVAEAEMQANLNRDDIRRRRPHTHVITVRGDAHVTNFLGEEIIGERLSLLDGESSAIDFIDYAEEKFPLFINCGYLRFKYDDGKLYSLTEYNATREPSEEELRELEEYTVGQWSDGIGEGFEQESIDGFYISAWHRDQEVTINVEKVEGKC